MKAAIDRLQKKSWEALEWNKIKGRLAELATSPLGQQLCLDLPLADEEASVVAGLQGTTECKELLEEEGDVPLGGIHDLRGLLERVTKGAVLDPQDLWAVSDTLRAGSRLKSFFQQRIARAPLLGRLTQSLCDLREVEGAISRCFDATGNLSDAASPQLRTLRRQVRLLHQRVQDHLNAILSSPSYAQVLQEHYYTMRANRYVIPVKAEARSRVVGIVHDSSLSGATVFIEPQGLIDLNNQLKMAELELEREVYRILQELSARVAGCSLEISSNLAILGQLDLVYGKARLSQKLEARAPEISGQGRVRLLQARHPLLVLGGEEVVPNTILLERERKGLIISGPNAGGKTIALKTLGLCALMLRAGLHLPVAPGSEMPVFSGIFADIGDQQSIEGSLSTFSAHLLNIIEILEHAGPGTLALLDEIATSTDPDEGASLARAILEQLVSQGALVLATTHYGQLKSLAIQDSRFANAGMELHMADLRPTYRLAPDTPGRSFGMEIARRLGLSSEVYRRAKELLGEDQTGLDALLKDLESRRSALRDEQKLLERLRHEAENSRGEYQERLARLKEKREEVLTRSLREVTSVVSHAKREIEALLKEARADRRVERLREARKSLAGVEDRVRRTVRETRQEPHIALAPVEGGAAPCRPGERVEVISVGKTGTLLDDPSQANRVRVQVGPVKMTVGTEDLRPCDPVPSPSPSRSSALLRDSSSAAPLRLPENTCDLRGLKVEEALDQVDKTLDQAMLQNLTQVCFIHGHGTGALKSSLRRHLESSPYVETFRPGQPQEGGDGVTWAELGN